MIRRLEDLDLADDFALLSHIKKDIREKKNKFSKIGKKVGLNINSKKTKVIKLRQDTVDQSQSRGKNWKR